MLPHNIFTRIYRMIMELESEHTQRTAKMILGPNPTADSLILSIHRNPHPIFMKIYEECAFWLNNKAEYRIRNTGTEITKEAHIHTYDLIDKYDNVDATFSKILLLDPYAYNKRKWVYTRVSNGRRYVMSPYDQIIYELVPRSIEQQNRYIYPGANMDYVESIQYKKVKTPKNNFVNQRFLPLYKYDEYIPVKNGSNILKNKINDRFQDISFITQE